MDKSRSLGHPGWGRGPGVCVFFNFYLLIFGCSGPLLLHGSSLTAVSEGYSSLWYAGFSVRWLLLLWITDSRQTGFSSCGGSGLVTPRNVGSSWTRDWTHGPCLGRQVPNHWTTMEDPCIFKRYYLLIWLCQVLAGAWGIFIVSWGIFCWGAWILQLQHLGSVVTARAFSCFEACGIIVPQTGMELASPALQGEFISSRPPGKPAGPRFWCGRQCNLLWRQLQRSLQRKGGGRDSGTGVLKADLGCLQQSPLSRHLLLSWARERTERKGKKPTLLAWGWVGKEWVGSGDSKTRGRRMKGGVGEKKRVRTFVQKGHFIDGDKTERSSPQPSLTRKGASPGIRPAWAAPSPASPTLPAPRPAAT